MANVNIPTTSVDPNEQDVGKLVKQLLNAYIILTEELTFLLNNLDTRNLNEVDGDILVTGTVTAAKMMVEKLSAISADLGKIVAGEIYGTYIATRENAYPRSEMSASDDMFSAFYNANNFIRISAVGGNNSPQLLLSSTFANLLLLMLGTTANISVTGGNLNLHTTENMELTADEIRLFPNNFRGIRVSAFSDIVDDSSGKSLQDVLNEKQNK